MVAAIRAMALSLVIALSFISPTSRVNQPQYDIPTVYVVEQKQEVEKTPVEKARVITKEIRRYSTQVISQELPIEEEIVEKPVEEELLSQEEIELIALVTMAEAEGESEYGKRLVIDTILNRVDHNRFPDSVREVIYQPHQFTSMTNGRADRCYVRDDICQLVREELKSRTNSEVMFFTAGNYGKYGTPMFQEGNHYFASY